MPSPRNQCVASFAGAFDPLRAYSPSSSGGSEPLTSRSVAVVSASTGAKLPCFQNATAGSYAATVAAAFVPAAPSGRPEPGRTVVVEPRLASEVVSLHAASMPVDASPSRAASVSAPRRSSIGPRSGERCISGIRAIIRGPSVARQ